MPKGGFLRKVRFGHFIREYLSGGKEAYAGELYQAYIGEVQSVARKGKNAHVMSYGSFRAGLFLMRKIGLIAYVDKSGGLTTDPARAESEASDMPNLAPKLFFTLVPGQDGNPAWDDIWAGTRTRIK